MSILKKLFGLQKSSKQESSNVTNNKIKNSVSQQKKQEEAAKSFAAFAKANPNIANESLEAAAAKAIKEGVIYLDVCKFLLESGADPNKYNIAPPIFTIIMLTDEIFMKRFDQSKVYELVQLFLLKGANPNVTLQNGYGHKSDPLGRAIANKSEKIALLLLENGADPQFTRNNYCTRSYYEDDLKNLENFLEMNRESLAILQPKQPENQANQIDSTSEIIMIKSILFETMNAETFISNIKKLGFKYEEESIMGLMMQSQCGQILLKIKSSVHPSNIATLLYLDKKNEKETYLVEDGIKCY
jgi:hypothetical protein